MRRQIMVLVIGLTTLVILAFAIPVAILIRNAVVDRAERSTIDQANNLALVVQNSRGNVSSIEASLNGLTQNADHRANVVLPDGTVLGQPPPGGDAAFPFRRGFRGTPTAGTSSTPSAPTGTTPAPAATPSPVVPGRDDGRPPPGGPGGDQAQLRSISGGKVATLTVPTTGGFYLVAVYASTAALHEGELGWLLLLAGGGVALLAIGVLAGELLTRRIVRPLVQTADTAHQLTAGDVTARAPTTGPHEVAEVGSSLNQLADRIDELVAEERETVANLSHRMRTPLTALRLESESLADPGERERIGTQVSALERTLTAVIHAARRPQREGRLPSTDATAVVHDRVAFWSALTDEQERTCTLTVPDGPVLVRSSGEDLATAVDALLENVVAHTPERTPFAVSLVDQGADGAQLRISDSGPGLPDGAGVRGRSDRGSSGLGLDIARRCAQASGGWMETGRSPSGGALVVLHLGAP